MTIQIKQVDKEARKRFYDSIADGLSSYALAKLDKAFATQRSTYEARIAELERELDEARSAYRDAADGWESASKSLSACQVANAAAEARLAEAVEVIRPLMPSNLNLNNAAWPDETTIPLDFTLGELRRAARFIQEITGAKCQS